MSKKNSNRTQDDDAESSSSSSSAVPPSHVRKLNFSQSTTYLNDDDDQIDTQSISQPRRTQKYEFVRRWIETQSQNDSQNNVESLFLTSSTFGELRVKRANKSPDLSTPIKRARIDAMLNNNDSPRQRVEIEFQSSQKNVDTLVSSSTKNVEPMDVNNALDTKENVFTPPSISAEVQDTKESPIISTGLYKRKFLKFKKGNPARKPLAVRLDNFIDSNAYSELLTSNAKNLDRDSNLSTQYKNILYHLLNNNTAGDTCNNKMKTESIDVNQINVIDSNHMENYNIDSTSNVSDSQRELNIEDSPKLENEKESIDMESLTKEACDINNEIDSLSSNERDDNNIIDDANSLEALAKNRKYENSDALSEISNDSDATYCPDAEEILAKMRSEVMHRVSSTTKEISQSTSNGTSANISNVTSPLVLPEPPKTATLSYLERKVSKPKKGTQSERLASLINNQTSFVRIWRHQLKQSAKDNAPIPAVKVYVEKCIDLYSRQFLEGYVVDDPFHLIPDSAVNKDESSTSRPERRITLMTVPEIVGKISMEIEFMIQIAPPWQILDNNNLLLRITYLSILSGKNTVSIQKVDDEQKSRVIQVFDCPCMESDKLLPNCTKNDGKPNVMAKLFSE